MSELLDLMVEICSGGKGEGLVGHCFEIWFLYM